MTLHACKLYTINVQPTVVIKREPNPAPESTPWTGIGFMQVFEGSELTFLIPNIFRTLQYDLVVRYEHTGNFPIDWEKVSFEIISLDGPASEECNGSADGSEGANNPPEYDTDPPESTTDGVVALIATVNTIATGEFSMPAGTKQTTITPAICFERGKRYNITFTFGQYDASEKPAPDANINIDSVGLYII